MKSLPKSTREFYASLDKHQLIAFLLNQDYQIQRFQEKLKMLTGCGNYGDCDGMDGSCVDCYYDNLALHNKCREFQDEIFKKRNEEAKNEGQPEDSSPMKKRFPFCRKAKVLKFLIEQREKRSGKENP